MAGCFKSFENSKIEDLFLIIARILVFFKGPKVCYSNWGVLKHLNTKKKKKDPYLVIAAIILIF